MEIIVPKLQVVAMGSALLTEREQIFTRQALDMTGEQKPTVLTINTAKATAESCEAYAEKTQAHFTNLGASVLDLHQFEQPPSSLEIVEKIGAASMLFVAGGNTRAMINFWRQNNIAAEIESKIREGVVLAGGSAGALAWFELGHSDAEFYEKPEGEPWEYILTEGLGFIGATACPHFDSKTADNEPRRDNFTQLLIKNDHPMPAIGITNRAALVIDGEDYRTLSVDETGAVFTIELDSNDNATEIQLDKGKIADL